MVQGMPLAALGVEARSNTMQYPEMDSFSICCLTSKTLAADIGWNALKNDITDMYLPTFSEQELVQINAFYITPARQKVIKVVPELVTQRNQLAMQRLQ